MAWFNLTPLAKFALAANVAHGVSEGLKENARRNSVEAFSPKTSEQKMAMTKTIIESAWAQDKSKAEIMEFLQTMTDERYINMFGPIPGANVSTSIRVEEKDCVYCGKTKQCYYCNKE